MNADGVPNAQAILLLTAPWSLADEDLGGDRKEGGRAPREASAAPESHRVPRVVRGLRAVRPEPADLLARDAKNRCATPGGAWKSRGLGRATLAPGARWRYYDVGSLG